VSLRFAGYAALFDNRDAGRDVIRKGAFARTLAARKEPLPLYWQHRPDQRIGWIESASEDARGLRVIGSVDNPDGGAGQALQRHTVSGLSFGYVARDSRRDQNGRELLDVDLFEISLVSHPMQHGARVHLVGPASTLFEAAPQAAAAWIPEDHSAAVRGGLP
jgi:HK97 family phage prohead protease